MMMVYNNMKYNPEEYGEDVIEKEASPAVAYLNFHDNELAVY